MQKPKENKVQRPEIRLPFERRKTDSGEWVYEHRAALCITIIVYLVLGIAFLSSKIILEKRTATAQIIVDFDDLEKLRQELEKAEELNRKLNEEQRALDDFRDVRNAASNENAELDKNLPDDRGSNAEEIYNSASKVQEHMAASRRQYEQGLREEQAMIDAHRAGKGSGKQSDAKIEGRVTVSFSLTNPLRTAAYLFVPAYQCEGGGRVVVDITVDRNGDVIAADVNQGRSSNDYCMTTTALEAARKSRFNVNPSAPTKQNGTITYIFIPH